eukprot:8920286-Prorocentrum_lima.AAC.1
MPTMPSDTSPTSTSLRKWCSGFGTLSARAKAAGTPHFPPMDYRYGWSLARMPDQAILLAA